jgi:hypothetical protein
VMAPSPSELTVYDGRDRVGSLVVRPGAVDAFDTQGIHLGSFKTLKAAHAAINTSLSSSCVCDTSARRDNSP